MARITNPYKEMVDSHTTEEVLAYIYELLGVAKMQGALIDGQISKEQLVLSVDSSLIAHEILRTLMMKLDILDDSPSIVA